ncbi:antithrombin-III-like [Brachionichthys hirsutus]|uniref:antithrombin-III-like n=1 Tax=Brachionichthys hirsutus TaxID=412623 RepID=UPI0036043D73
MAVPAASANHRSAATPTHRTRTEGIENTSRYICMQGQWKNKFDKANVYAADFHVSQSATCPVSMMYQETRFRYGHFPDDGVQVLEMPYRGDDITMVIVLPSRGTPLSQVEDSLDLKKLTDWIGEMRDTTVSIYVPRFRVEDSFSLKEKLQAMGLTDLFSQLLNRTDKKIKQNL